MVKTETIYTQLLEEAYFQHPELFGNTSPKKYVKEDLDSNHRNYDEARDSYQN